ncbi:MULTISPECIES: phosphatase PAP2 family protein [unclassified Arthrobacter]|uniref:phosphatase PAP2 family protein n=1 Tax=unclassified Arthrobacter TaxID=235627 RepID=UPI001CFFD90E|nr:MULTISPECIES: phosphatase PAP2 family protein [unclassified Arthrobacter]MCB5282512.1 Undecaprenyl-diphosphatase BcrC [Arthrobacter sp. ES1]WGZ81248.1 phosphatase PAP2 family protein [Arthrobacter sp. EM1]
MTGPAHAGSVTAPRDSAGLKAAAGPQPWAIPQPRHWLLWGILLSAAVIALGATAQLLPGGTAAELGVDQDLSQHHAAILTGLAMTLNLVFGPAAGVAFVAAAALYLWVIRRSLVKAIAFGIFASSGWVASGLFKLIIARQRPNPALLADPLSPETGSNSFPSGHVSFAVALGFAVYFLVRGTRWAKATAFAAAALALVVAWSRLYIGVHYPTDVVASFLAASAAVVLLSGLWNRFAVPLLDRVTAPAALRSSQA